jgi:hypothetical protein
MAWRSIRTLFLRGWIGALALAIVYLATEFALFSIGGDWGAFLYVTFHFILGPIMSLVVLIATLLALRTPNTWPARGLLLLSTVVPFIILYLAITGSSLPLDLLGVRVRR